MLKVAYPAAWNSAALLIALHVTPAEYCFVCAEVTAAAEWPEDDFHGRGGAQAVVARAPRPPSARPAPTSRLCEYDGLVMTTSDRYVSLYLAHG